MEQNKGEKEPSRRYILDKNTGLNVRINIYIIRYLFSHMEKAERFMDRKGERRKSIDFYNHIGISRQRMYRMLNGTNFEVSATDREELSRRFNISKDYFEKNGKVIEIHKIKTESWRIYLNERYEFAENSKLPHSKIKEAVNEVENGLKNMLKNNEIENQYDTTSALYRVYYYWKTGNTYINESKLRKFTKALNELKKEDWDEIENDLQQMERYRNLLLGHADYLRVIVEYKKIKNQ